MNWLKEITKFHHGQSDDVNALLYKTLRIGVSDEFLYDAYFDGMNKGQRMVILFSKEEFKNVDTAIPIEFWKGRNAFYYCYNYNNNTIGELCYLVKVFKERILSKYEK